MCEEKVDWSKISIPVELWISGVNPVVYIDS